MLRIALLVIGAIGTLTVLKDNFKMSELPCATILLFKGAFFILGIAIACSLAHRYFATDSMSYYISYLRNENKEEKTGYIFRFKVCSWLLLINAIAFGIGICLFASGLFAMP